jgi:hypothetical protein
MRRVRMQLLVFVIFVITIGLFQINAKILKNQKISKGGKNKYYPPNFYRIKSILFVLNIAPIISLITAISLFLVFEWWIALAIIVIVFFSKDVWAKFSEHAIIHPMYYFFGRK